MKQKNLWIICGAPGSGKSTWLLEHAPKEAVIVSRDKIRFSMLTEDDEYFEHEKEVYKEFCKQIKDSLENSEIHDVYADATHLSPGARLKLLNSININFDEININCINFIIPLEVCLARNEQRKGLTYVPRGQIRRMHMGFVPAEKNELKKYQYNLIININKDGIEE